MRLPASPAGLRVRAVCPTLTAPVRLVEGTPGLGPRRQDTVSPGAVDPIRELLPVAAPKRAAHRLARATVLLPGGAAVLTRTRALDGAHTDRRADRARELQGALRCLSVRAGHLLRVEPLRSWSRPVQPTAHATDEAALEGVYHEQQDDEGRGQERKRNGQQGGHRDEGTSPPAKNARPRDKQARGHTN